MLYPFTSHRYRLGLWHSPEPKFTTSKGLPLGLALACVFPATFLIIALRRRSKGPNSATENLVGP